MRRASRPQPPAKARRRYPLHVTLLQMVTALVVLTAAGVGLSNYQNARSAMGQLSGDLTDELARETAARTRAFLGAAPPALELSRGVLLEHAAPYGTLSPRPASEREWRARARLLLRVLRANPAFNKVYYGDRWGTWTGARREPGPVVLVDHRWIQGGAHRRLVYRVEADGRWRPAPELAREGGAVMRHYDPRVDRPWYREARRHRRLVWTEPYLFASQRPGITAALPVPGPGRDVAGVLGVDFELLGIGTFLGRMETEGPKVFVLARGGADGQYRTVAEPESRDLDPLARSPASSGGYLDLPLAARSSNPVLRAAIPALSAAQGAAARHSVGGPDLEWEAGGTRYLGASYPFVVGKDLRWHVVVGVPEESVLGVVRQNTLWTGLLCLLVIALGLFTGTWVSNAIARPLRAFAGEMRQVADLHIPGRPSPGSVILEVDEMGRALERMKAGLRSFEKYVPSDVVRLHLRTGQEARLGGQTTAVTLLFADLVGFTALSERLAPAELVELLAGYLGGIEEVVRHHGGLVDKYVGDGVMAFWNAPLRPVGEGERRACEAALDYLDRLRGRPDPLGRVDARFGIHTGEALVGNIGSEHRMGYTAVGDSVNLTSRLEGLNRLYGTRILLSEAAWAAVEGQFETRPIDLVAVKGRSGALPVYELLARRGGLEPGVAERVEHFAEGLRLYRERDWSGAERRFLRALRCGPGEDGPSRVYLSRCRRFQTSPPPEPWDGVFVAPEK